MNGGVSVKNLMVGDTVYLKKDTREVRVKPSITCPYYVGEDMGGKKITVDSVVSEKVFMYDNTLCNIDMIDWDRTNDIKQEEDNKDSKKHSNMKRVFDSLVRAGFTENQSLKIMVLREDIKNIEC